MSPYRFSIGSFDSGSIEDRTFFFEIRAQYIETVLSVRPSECGMSWVFSWISALSVQFLPWFTWFYRVLSSVTGFYWVVLGCTGLYWVLLGFTRFYWVLLGFTGFCWVLLGCTGFYWVAMFSSGFL